MSLFGKDAAGRLASRMLLVDSPPDELEELHAFSVRVPASMKALIDELAEHAGQSRNSIAIDLLSAGIEEVISRLPPEMANDIYESAHERML